MLADAAVSSRQRASAEGVHFTTLPAPLAAMAAGQLAASPAPAPPAPAAPVAVVATGLVRNAFAAPLAIRPQLGSSVRAYMSISTSEPASEEQTQPAPTCCRPWSYSNSPSTSVGCRLSHPRSRRTSRPATALLPQHELQLQLLRALCRHAIMQLQRGAAHTA